MSANERLMLPDDAARIRATFAAMLDGEMTDSDIVAFLVALAERGETAEEITAAALALRARMTPITAPVDAIDVCGTGGDGSHSLNVSTAVAFVVAAAGVPVAKHGNRAASSQSGAADVLAAMGWAADLPFDRLERCLDEIGIVFLHAQRHHPAMARVAPIRRALGRRTIFNLLGPLANPAGVRRQMVGVFSAHWLEPMAEACRLLGAESALLLNGDGLDEIGLHGPSRLLWLRDGVLRPAVFDPTAYGMALRPLALLRGGSPEDNAMAMRSLFAGDVSTPALLAYRDIVVANAAAALKLAGHASGWRDATAKASELLASGAAADRLARFLAFR